MKVKPILDNFEIKAIQHISTIENRALIEHRVPGMEGSLFQDLGTDPTLITIRGSLNYNESRQDVLNLEELRTKFQAARPVPFVADITTATKVKEVLIRNIEIRESEKSPEYFDYFIELNEHVPEPPPSDVQSDVNEEAEERHNNKVQMITEKIITLDIKVDVEKGEKVEILVYDSSGAVVRTIKKPEPDGRYLAENLPLGEYTASVRKRGQ